MQTSPIHPPQTRGGLSGHLLRRLMHISMGLVPIGYYYFFPTTPRWLLFFLMGLLAVLEAWRLCTGWIAFGQRSREARQISSFSWGLMSIFLVLLFAPGKAFAIPIIISCALGDPLLGELRRLRIAKLWVALIGLVFIAGLWAVSTYYLGTPLWWAFVMGPFIVLCEWPNLSWIDDNAMMQLLPLLLVWGVVIF